MKSQTQYGILIVLAIAFGCSCAQEKQDSPESQPNEQLGGGAADRLGVAIESLRGIGGPEIAKQKLSELKLYLLSLPKDEAVAALTASLESGEDAKFPVGFEISPDGFLAGHPTWRVALLDWLGEIDPQAAAEFSKMVLENPTTADEWAIAMRNYARGSGEPGSTDYLGAKVVEMIDYPEWKSAPSRGYFEAFDVFVHTRAVGSTSKLSSLVGDRTPEGRPLAHAAFLTLDRLTQVEPEKMYAALAEEKQLFEARGPMVANFFARADLRRTGEREQVEKYLLDPNRSQEELAAFAGVYPNANQMISHNLLTKTQTPAGAELIAHDRAALAIVSSWLEDQRFADPKIRPHLQTMQRRLAEFVRQGSGG